MYSARNNGNTNVEEKTLLNKKGETIGDLKLQDFLIFVPGYGDACIM